MANTELNIWLKVKNQASSEIQKVQSKMQSFTASVKKNWIAIAAGIASAAILIKKAFDFAVIGAKAQQIEAAFNKMAVAMGADAKMLREEILKASKATVNFSNVAAQASVLLGRGVSQAQLIDIFKVARVEAQKTGQSVEDSFNQISGAISGGFLVTVKRNYGLAVDLASAYDNYAKQTGKTVEQVRKYYSAQALANQIIQAAQMDLSAFNSEMRTNYEHLQTLGAWWTSFKEVVGQVIIAIVQMMAVLVKTIQSSFAILFESISRLTAASIGGLEKTLAAINKIAKSDSINEMIEKLDNARIGMDTWAEAGKMAGTEFAAASREIASYIGKTDEITQEQKKAMQAMAEQLRSQSDDVNNNFKIMEELAKNTATNIQNSFADSFFKAFKGELRSAQEVFAAFGESMLQTISNILAQIITYYAIIGPLTKAFPGLEKVFGAFGSYQLGTSYVPQTGLYMLHRGETVTPQSRQDPGGGGSQVVNYYIHAADARSFSELLHQNRSSVHQIVQENISRRGILTQKIRTR